MLLLRLALLPALLALALLPAAAPAAVPAGAEYTEEFIEPTRPGQEELHVDVLRPAGLPEGAKTPVIAIVSPYLGHADGGERAPSSRFDDFLEGAKVFERGYSVVLVDLRGSGGSSGCLDILGPGEQEDIRTAVEWAAAQPWSTGRVGMYGKSYDGNTGVVGAALRPQGLSAVVAQQVVGDRYSGSYSGGVRYLQSFAYPSVTYGASAEGGFTLQDDERYTLNSVGHSADCQPGLAGHYDRDPGTEFWRSRDFVAKGAGSTVPFLMTTGFLDANTNIGAKAIDFYNGLKGPKRLWLGWWDHVRGNDLEGDRLAMGRAGWFDEVVRFYDEHLKGMAPSVEDPLIAVQDSQGRWREEAAWPPQDARDFTAPLKPGVYEDDGRNLGSRDLAAGAGGGAVTSWAPYRTGAGVWTFSPPLPHTTHLAGIPRAEVDVAAIISNEPRGNVVVNLYDVDPEGRATMISRGARLVDEPGTPSRLALYPVEWTLAPGHRIGVLVSGSNAEAWLHESSQNAFRVDGGTVTLPVLERERLSDLPGDRAPRLEEYLERAPFAVEAATVDAATEPALVPPAQRPARPGEPAPEVDRRPPPAGDPAPPAESQRTGGGPAASGSGGSGSASSGGSAPSGATPAASTPRPAAGTPPATARRGRLTARLNVGRARTSRPAVAGRAPTGTRVRVELVRKGKVIARRTTVARRGAYRVRFKIRGSRSRLVARVSALVGGRELRAAAFAQRRRR